MIFLLHNGINLVLVILFVSCRGLLLLQLFFQLIEALQFAMRPALHTVFAALLFQCRDADAQFARSRIDG